ncbi:hypothetical protein Q8A73_000234 [Channa argus]|nr:hypothetical protein Q8A73_000234 [Channa argus]
MRSGPQIYTAWPLTPVVRILKTILLSRLQQEPVEVAPPRFQGLSGLVPRCQPGYRCCAFNDRRRRRRRKRGSRGGKRNRLRRRGNRLHHAVKCPIATEQSEELSTLVKSDLDYRQTSLFCFTGTWLSEDVDVQLDGFNFIRFDIDTATTGKSIGGRICLAANITVLETL